MIRGELRAFFRSISGFGRGYGEYMDLSGSSVLFWYLPMKTEVPEL